MKIETKYDVGDIVWIKRNGKAIIKEIEAISIFSQYLRDTGSKQMQLHTNISYRMTEDETAHIGHIEENVYSTKAECVETIINQTK